jgi:hypothetical protein
MSRLPRRIWRRRTRTSLRDSVSFHIWSSISEARDSGARARDPQVPQGERSTDFAIWRLTSKTVCGLQESFLVSTARAKLLILVARNESISQKSVYHHARPYKSGT